MNGSEVIGPVQWIVDVIRPLLTWTGVQDVWIQSTALNTVLLTSFIVKLFAWKGWRVLVISGAWAALYACAEYLPSILATVAGAAVVFIMTSLAMKAGGLLRTGYQTGAKVLANPSKRT